VDTRRIAAFSVLADLPAAELDDLAAAMSELEVEAGAKVVTLDDCGTAIYFVEQGEADVDTEGGEATETLGPGDTLGEIALLLTGERTTTVSGAYADAAPFAVRSGLRAHPTTCT
jgi:CRP-like cAMP-binding protein